MMKNFILTLSVCIVMLIFSSCAVSRAALKPGFDFSKIQSVKIGDFSSAANQPNSGAVIANAFMRELLLRGFAVKISDSDSADAVLMGNVSEYQPNRRYLIKVDNKQNAAAQTIVIQQPIELGGSNTYNLGSAFGLGDDNRIIVSNATVGISAYLKDIRTGEIVWSNAYTYEGLDLNTAVEGAVRYLLGSLPKYCTPQ